MVIKRGDIFYADLRPVVGSEQGGIRPVLIIQNNVGNRHSPTVICAAITSKMNKAKCRQLCLVHFRCNGCADHCGAMPVAHIVLNDQHRTDATLLTSHHRP